MSNNRNFCKRQKIGPSNETFAPGMRVAKSELLSIVINPKFSIEIFTISPPLSFGFC